jgi:hypothetical protein
MDEVKQVFRQLGDWKLKFHLKEMLW